MNDELQIVRIQVGVPEPSGIPNPKTGDVPHWLPIAITVHNPTTDVSFHVLASLQSLDYDRVTRTLELLFTEPGEDPNPAVTVHFFMPFFERIYPGATQAIEVSVPAVINRMTDMSREGVSVERLPVQELQQVHCVIAYSEEPFRPEPAATNEGVRKQMALWGKVAEATLPPEMVGQGEAS